MSYVGYSNWPPLWAWIEGKEDKKPMGEVGILREVIFYKPSVLARCFLIIEYEESRYIGALLFDDLPFCRQVVDLLQACCGQPMKLIGDLDISHTL
jgi:hypothetical protein